MGADEYYYHLYHTGTPAPGSQVDFRAIGFPDSGCTLIRGSGCLSSPMLTAYGELWLDFPLTLFNQGNFPSTGFQILTYTIPSYLPSGKRLYYQLLTGKRLTNLMTLMLAE